MENEYESIQTDLSRASVLFACAIHRASRVLRVKRPVQRPSTSAARKTVASGITATRCTDCFVSGRLVVADTGRLHVSNADCRSGPLDGKPFQSERRGTCQGS